MSQNSLSYLFFGCYTVVQTKQFLFCFSSISRTKYWLQWYVLVMKFWITSSRFAFMITSNVRFFHIRKKWEDKSKFGESFDFIDHCFLILLKEFAFFDNKTATTTIFWIFIETNCKQVMLFVTAFTCNYVSGAGVHLKQVQHPVCKFAPWKHQDKGELEYFSQSCLHRQSNLESSSGHQWMRNFR